MNRTKHDSNNRPPGFAIPLTKQTELDSGMLTAEGDEQAI
jgi:hypothetical protein